MFLRWSNENCLIESCVGKERNHKSRDWREITERNGRRKSPLPGRWGSAVCSQYAHTSHCCAELSFSDSYPTMSREPSIPELDLSDDEHHFAEISNRKRSSRGEYYHSTLLSRPISKFRLACDQCRKTKSKCERFKGDDEPCKSCLAAGTGTEHFPLRTPYAS